MVDLRRFDEEVHEVLAYASGFADQCRSESISGTHVVYSAMQLNQLLADRVGALGIAQEQLYRAVCTGALPAMTKIPFSSVLESALYSSAGDLSSLLSALVDQDSELLAALQECSTSSASVDDIRRVLSQPLGQVKRSGSPVVEAHGEIFGRLQTNDPQP